MSFIISGIICSYDNIYFRLNQKRLSVKNRLSEGFTVTYHAGAMHTKPNTIKSIEAALKRNATVVEFDVSFRPDGTPVIIHSSAPTANQGVLLKDALEAVAKHPSCKINLDIKSTSKLCEVDKLVKACGLWNRVFYTGVFVDWVDAVRSSSDIPYYINYNLNESESESTAAFERIANLAEKLGATGINSSFENASKNFCDFMHGRGLLVSLWTVNKPVDMIKVLGYNPDNITTKRPCLLELLIK